MPNTLCRIVALMGGLAMVASCGGDATGPNPPGRDPVASVVVSPAALTLAIGSTSQLTGVPRRADGEPLDGRTITWSSSDEAIASVDETGLVTAVSAGEVEVAAASEGKQGRVTVTVSDVAVATVEVDPATATLPLGQSMMLTAIAKDADGNVLADRPAAWSTEPRFLDVISVSATGQVTAVGQGNATMTATIEGKTGTSELTVTARPGIVRTWKGGAGGAPTEWGVAANWNPAGKPIPLDSVRVPSVQHGAVLFSEAEVAQLIIAGGTLRVRATLRVKGKYGGPEL